MSRQAEKGELMVWAAVYASRWAQALEKREVMSVPIELYNCRKCKEKQAECQEWDSICGGYTDPIYRLSAYRYQCRVCGYAWWVDGDDG